MRSFDHLQLWVGEQQLNAPASHSKDGACGVGGTGGGGAKGGGDSNLLHPSSAGRAGSASPTRNSGAGAGAGGGGGGGTGVAGGSIFSSATNASASTSNGDVDAAELNISEMEPDEIRVSRSSSLHIRSIIFLLAHSSICSRVT